MISSLFNGILISVLDCTISGVGDDDDDDDDDDVILSSIGLFSIINSSCVNSISTVLNSIFGFFITFASSIVSFFVNSNFSSITGMGLSIFVGAANVLD